MDHISRWRKPEDFVVHEIADESIIIVRAADGELRAHFNVCRHRGSRICVEESGHVSRLVCPYHAWAYSLEGKLESARQMAPGFDRQDYSLHPCKVAVLNGLVFINLQENPGADFDVLAADLQGFIAPHGLEHAKIVHREVYPTNANWKLVVENFRECYHCTHAHPEYAQVNAYVRAHDRDIGNYTPVSPTTADTTSKYDRRLSHQRYPYPPQPHTGWRQPIREGFLTLTEDGKPAGPLMGDFAEYDGAETGIVFGCLSYFYLANDHTTAFRFTPKSATYTEVELTWLVHEDAENGVDYDVERVKWMWDVTTIQDTKIINDNQKGVNSRRYTPGPYSLREASTASFIEWYLDRLSSGMTAG